MNRIFMKSYRVRTRTRVLAIIALVIFSLTINFASNEYRHRSDLPSHVVLMMIFAGLGGGCTLSILALFLHAHDIDTGKVKPQKIRWF
jgi:hypothetical protein